MQRRHLFLGVLSAALLSALLSACVHIPSSGPVHEAGEDFSDDKPLGYSYVPAGPVEGEAPSSIVTHFLDAMTATPISTSVARQFLTDDAAATWQPDRATLTYAEVARPQGGSVVTAHLTGVNRIDGNGRWRGRVGDGESDLDFTMSQQDGQWRISRLPDALIVPQSWFEDRFRPVSLAFYDPTGRSIVPEPAFVPSGEQLASVLVTRLLAGPSASLKNVARTFIPDGTKLELSVPIDSRGVATVALAGDPGSIASGTARLMLSQLAWTLRQVPEVTSISVTVGGAPLALSGGATTFALSAAILNNAAWPSAPSQLFALSNGGVVYAGSESDQYVGGPFGVAGSGLGSFSVSITNDLVAGVTTDGDSLAVAPLSDPGGAITYPLGGTHLIRPSWDFAGNIWAVDNQPIFGRGAGRQGGAVVRVVAPSGAVTAMRVPGITGEDVSRFLVSRDGSRVAALVRQRGGDIVVAARVQHDPAGHVTGITDSGIIDATGQSGHQVFDIAWISPTRVAVLSRLTNDLSQISVVSVDGSSTVLGSAVSIDQLRGRFTHLAGSPLEGQGLYAFGPDGIVNRTDVGDDITFAKGLSNLTWAG